MKCSNLMATPLDPRFKLSTKQSPTTTEDKTYMKCVSYASANSSLLYVMICIHPNIS